MSVRATYRFARIPEWVLVHKDLEPIDVRVFGLLDRYDGTDCIPKLATLASRLGVSPDTVRRAKTRLEAAGAIVVESRIIDDSGTEVNAGGRQTSNRYWLAGDAPLQGRPCTPAGGDPCTPAGGDPCTAARAEREKEQSREPKKRKKITFSSDVTPRTIALGRELCVLLAELTVANGCKTRFVETSAAGPGDVPHAWELEAELMIRVDGRDPVEAAELLRWVQADSFWKANVLSLPKFRAKYDQLRLARESRNAPPPWQKVDRTNRNPDNIAPRDAPGRVSFPAHLPRKGKAMRERLDALVGVTS